MSVATQHDIGAIITSAAAPGIDPNVVTAGTGADGTEQDGNWVDRSGKLSAKLIITYTTTLAQDATLSFAINGQDASDSSGTGAADYGTAFANAVVATGGAGGSTEKGKVEIDFNLGSADGFLRAQVTPTLSAVAADTVAFAAVWVFGGASNNPAS